MDLSQWHLFCRMSKLSYRSIWASIPEGTLS
jgi:hypothetical protein